MALLVILSGQKYFVQPESLHHASARTAAASAATTNHIVIEVKVFSDFSGFADRSVERYVLVR